MMDWKGWHDYIDAKYDGSMVLARVLTRSWKYIDEDMNI